MNEPSISFIDEAATATPSFITEEATPVQLPSAPSKKSPTNPKGGGRKPSPTLSNLTDAQYDHIQELSAQGRSRAFIARALKVSPPTLANYCDPEYQYFDERLHEAIEAGRLADVAEVEQALRLSAVNGNYNAAKRYLEKRDPENWAEDTSKAGGNTIVIVDTGITRTPVTIEGVAIPDEEGDTDLVF